MTKVVLAALLLSLTSCYSLAETRHPQYVKSGEEGVWLDLWIDERGWIDQRGLPRLPGEMPYSRFTIFPTFDGFKISEGFLALLSWPFDVVASTYCAVRAPFEESYRIAWGPLGAVAGITLPGCTLLPGLLKTRIPTAELEPEDYAALVDRVRAGDGTAAYLEIVGRVQWKTSKLPVVEVVERPTEPDPTWFPDVR